MSGDHKDSGWRKRQIALDKKSENARELGLDYEPDKTINRTWTQEPCTHEWPEQEPVACIWEKNDGYKSLEWGGLEKDEIQEIGLKSYTPLYTHLTQRTWVGLTDDKRNAIGRHYAYVSDIIKATEAELKKLNHD